MSLHTAEEAHFLVRVGQWSIARLQQWLQDHMDAEYEYDDQDREDYTDWDLESED